MKPLFKIGNRVTPTDGPHGKFLPREWIEVCRVGSWPNSAPFSVTMPDGTVKDFPKGCVQVINKEDLARMVDAFDYEPDSTLLIDVDHQAGSGRHATEASGWVVDLVLGNAALDPSGVAGAGDAGDACLWARPRYSAAGIKRVAGGEYLQLSPVLLNRFLPGEENKTVPMVSPNRLAEVALTNKPAMLLTKISNQMVGEVPAPIVTENPNPNPTPKMNQIAKLLGLGGAATEEEIRAAIAALQSNAAASETEVANHRAAAASRFVEDNQARIANTDAARQLWQAAHVANPANAQAMMDAITPAVVATANAARPVAPVFTATRPPVGVVTENVQATKAPADMTDAELFATYNAQPKGAVKLEFYRANRDRLQKIEGGQTPAA